MELSHFSVLNHLARAGDERTPAQLARAFHVTRGAMTNTLARLEWAGHVHIRPDWDDARRKFVAISPAGRAARDAAVQAVVPLIGEVVESLGADCANAAGAAGAARTARKGAEDSGLEGRGLGLLRIGNVVGADALLGPRTDGGPVVLDPVPGRDGGPLRSWIGPVTLARVLAALCRMACEDRLPSLLNLATAPPLPMADLLDAAGRAWRYGPPNPAVVPAAVLSAERLAALYPLPEARAGGLVAELARLRVSA
jgi:DNA-binding MarR family transcriptional regulator